MPSTDRTARHNPFASAAMSPRATRMRLLAAVLALSAVMSVGSAAEVAPDKGTIVAGTVTLAGKRIPLPPGQWQVAGIRFARVAGPPLQPYGAIARLSLIAADGNSNRGTLMLQTNVLPVRDGWGEPLECQSDDSLLHNLGAVRDLHAACSFVVARRRASLADMFSGIPPNQLPAAALVAGFRVSDRQDMVEMRYAAAVDPAWDPKPDGVVRPEVIELGEWSRRAQAGALAAVRLPASQVPATAIQDPAQPALAAGPPPGDVAARQLARYRDATDRLASGVLSVGAASMLTGSLYTGLVVATWQGIAQAGIWVGNELAWERRSRPAVVPVVLALPAGVSTEAPPSAEVRAGLTIDGKGVPLPGAGSWSIIATDRGADRTDTILASVQNGQLAGLAIVHTNPTMRSSIYGSAPECSDPRGGFAVIRYDTALDGYCAYGRVIETDLQPEDGSLWAIGLKHLRAQGVDVPATLAMVGARARTRRNLLDISWFVPASPTLDAASLAGFADLVQRPMEMAVRGRPDFQPAPLPWPTQGSEVSRAIVDQAVGPLRALNQAGVIDRAALQAQTSLAEDALAGQTRQSMSLWIGNGYKNATYRMASFASAVGVTWFVTASAAQGLAYAVINGVMQPALAYGNDALWSRFGSEPAPAPPKPVDFPTIGHPKS